MYTKQILIKEQYWWFDQDTCECDRNRKDADLHLAVRAEVLPPPPPPPPRPYFLSQLNAKPNTPNTSTAAHLSPDPT